VDRWGSVNCCDHSNSGQMKNAKPAFLSGLVSNWQSKVSTLSQLSLKARTPEHNGDTLALGGLNDEDALDTFSPVSFKMMGIAKMMYIASIRIYSPCIKLLT
jgi:hypothetical protein